jgi:DNA-binding transcriptional ArsR family regulator
MDEDKIVLDRKSFEALAVDTRVRILKSLRERRKTLTEISTEQKMSVSGIKEHLEILENVGLIEKIDDGHKWKYYELTKKGREIVGPKEVKVLILLSTSVVALLASILFLFSATTQITSMDMETAAPEAGRVADTYEDAAIPLMAAEAPPANKSENKAAVLDAPSTEQISGELQTADVIIAQLVAAISAITILISFGILAKNRMR